MPTALYRTMNAAFNDHGEVMKALEASLILSLDPAVSMLVGAIKADRKIITLGPLGSYMSRLFLTPQFAEPMPCLCLNGVENYSALIDANDALVVFCAENDRTTNEAVHTARRKGASTLGLTGAGGMSSRPDLEMRVPTLNIQRINEAHLFLAHILLENTKRGITNRYATQSNA